MASQAEAILTALAAALATATGAGLSAAKVVRGSPVDGPQGRQKATPPAAYVWLATLTSERATTHRWRHTLTAGWYLHATATTSTTGAMEAAALELLSAASAAMTSDPSLGGTCHDITGYGCDLNGTLPGADGSAPSAWVAGTVTIRYETTGGT